MKIMVSPRLVTETLSYGIYSKISKTIAEYVANAWDADATHVRIEIPEDFSSNPIVIEDNGEGIDIDAFSKIARNRQSNNKKYTSNSRPVIGSKGIGRWAGFAFASCIEYETVREGNRYKFSFDKSDFERFSTLEDYECIVVDEVALDANQGTRVKLWLLQEKTLLEPKEIIKDLSIEFAVNADFKITVNGQLLKEEDIPGKRIEIKEKSERFGDVHGYINVSIASKQRKRPPGIVIRVNGRRVMGPEFFGVDELLNKKILNRIRGEITANALEDIVTSNREAFIEHDEKYIEMKKWLQKLLLDIAETIQDEENIDIAKKIFAIEEVKLGYASMPSFKQKEFIRQVSELAPKLKRVSKDKDLLSLFAQLLLRAVDNNDFQRVLGRLQETVTEDVSLLSNVLQEWGFGEIARASTIIQERLKALDKFSELIRDDATLELQHIHRVLENNTWLLDERFDLYFSNTSLRKIAQQLGGNVEEEFEKQRPDLILKENSNQEFLIVELKRPSKTIDMQDVSQLLQYKTILSRNFPSIGNVDLYLIGRQFDQTVLTSFAFPNTQRLRLLSLDEVVQSSHHRLNWIAQQINEQLDTDENPGEVG